MRGAGLCGVCRHREDVVTRTARYLLCALSRTDRRFPKYPRLPVLECVGFVADDGGDDDA